MPRAILFGTDTVLGALIRALIPRVHMQTHVCAHMCTHRGCRHNWPATAGSRHRVTPLTSTWFEVGISTTEQISSPRHSWPHVPGHYHQTFYKAPQKTVKYGRPRGSCCERLAHVLKLEMHKHSCIWAISKRPEAKHLYRYETALWGFTAYTQGSEQWQQQINNEKPITF